MSHRARLWPSGLVGRVTLVLLAAILVEFLGTVIVFGEAERLLVRSTQAQRIAEQLTVADRVLAATPAGYRPAVARRLSTAHVELMWSREPGLVDDGSAVAHVVEDVVVDWEPVLGRRDLRLRVPAREAWNGAHLAGAVALADGSWLRFRSREPIARWRPTAELLLSLFIVAAAVIAVAALLVRTLGAPLRALANVADQIGFAHRMVEVEARGPGELKRLAGALNAMQARIRGLIESRTQALVAVSHDLRTPLSRLKLRLSAERGIDRVAALDDVDEMEAMLTSLLEFMRGGTGGQMQRLNLASLVMTEVEREQDLGRMVRYDGPARADVVGDHVALRRALANLIENALKYGGSADVSLAVAGDWATLAVRDHGPGMADEDLAQATAPFFRGDAARARDTKGLGLGLATVAQVTAHHDGTLDLQNADGGGLWVSVGLPLAPAKSAT